MSTTTKLPKGWQVELLGLINGVQFKHADGYGLLWSDGVWRSLSSNGASMPARLPDADTMKEARTIGTAWICERL